MPVTMWTPQRTNQDKIQGVRDVGFPRTTAVVKAASIDLTENIKMPSRRVRRKLRRTIWPCILRHKLLTSSSLTEPRRWSGPPIAAFYWVSHGICWVTLVLAYIVWRWWTSCKRKRLQCRRAGRKRQWPWEDLLLCLRNLKTGRLCSAASTAEPAQSPGLQVPQAAPPGPPGMQAQQP